MHARCILSCLPAALLSLLWTCPAATCRRRGAGPEPAADRGRLAAAGGGSRPAEANPLSGTDAKPEEDAAGAVDGVKNGKWGFHTENEANPWWQVDLQESMPIDRIELYNRCDMPERTARIKVLLSSDGKRFEQVYQHTGQPFLGYPDKKPLVVKLDGRPARYVRLQLPGTSLLPSGRGGDLPPGRPAQRRLAQAGHAEQRQPVVGQAQAGARRCAAPAGEVVSHGAGHRARAETGRGPAAAGRGGRCGRERAAAGRRAADGSAARRGGRGAAAAVLRGVPGGAQHGTAEPAIGFRHDLVRQAGAGPFSAHVRPVLRLVVAAGRRHLHPGGLQDGATRGCAA